MNNICVTSIHCFSGTTQLEENEHTHKKNRERTQIEQSKEHTAKLKHTKITLNLFVAWIAFFLLIKKSFSCAVFFTWIQEKKKRLTQKKEGKNKTPRYFVLISGFSFIYWVRIRSIIWWNGMKRTNSARARIIAH